MSKNTRYFSLITLSLFATIFTFGQKTSEEKINYYLQSNAQKIPLSESSVGQFEINRSTIDEKRGLTHHYLRQVVNDLPVLNGTAVFIEKDGNMNLASNRFVLGAFEVEANKSKINCTEVVDLVWAELTGEKSSSKKTVASTTKEGKVVVENPEYSREKIPVNNAYFFDGKMFRYIFEINIQMKDNKHWWNIYADANTGEILKKINWVLSCSFENCSDEKHFDHTALEKPTFQQQISMAPAPPPQNDSYRVLQIPIESPNHGVTTLAVGPFNSIASPFGWHDDNGLSGAEYTFTRGNNVYASEDANDDDSPGYSPDGGNALVFDFPINGGAPSSYLDASITNLFYMNNIMHDVWYQYGFDEQSGNFQQNNYGNGGLDNDFVNADAQDGSGTNNANFSTPPDGNNPRMQMFLWTDSPTSEFLTINAPSSLIGPYSSSIASFAPQPPVIPLTEDIIMVNSGGVEPMDACNAIVNFSAISGKIALVKRGTCTFAVKAENCQAAGALAVIIMNNVNTAPITMGGTPNVQINIPVIMVGLVDGNSFVSTLTNNVVLNGSISDQNSLTSTDSDLDNMIIAHEYGHGISTRLTGGPSNSDCLSNEDQMGEGWSDWFGLALTIEPGDLGIDKRGVGTYVQNEPTTGNGIRPAPYSTDFSINGFTYNATNSASISMPHGIGFVWCTVLWDLTWDFIAEYGFDPNMYTGTGGNNKIMELVIEGLKLQPCNPGAVDGRDAILLADQLINAGANECLIWKAFAKRGLGFNANQGSVDNRFDQNENFSIPLSCLVGLDESNLESNLTIFPNPTEDKITINSLNGNIDNITILDVDGREIFQTTPISSSNFIVDFSKYDSGIYFIVVNRNTIVNTRKVVKN